MKRFNKTLLPLSLALVFLNSNCNPPADSNGASDYDFPNAVDTNTRPIESQDKKVFDLGNGTFATNNFPAARLNDLSRVNDTLLLAKVAPENTPINNSAWYAFKIWSESPQSIRIKMQYDSGRHRYAPKISPDGKIWEELTSSQLMIDPVDSLFTYSIDIGTDTTWVAAQEIYDSRKVKQWGESMAVSDLVEMSVIGKSKLGRDLYFLDINSGDKNNKDLVVIFSRQHPPEVTGFFAMQAFVEQMISGGNAVGFFEKYRVLVYPLLNPDGVDLGHWRHNAGGIDLNRDWAYYRQPETRQIADHVVQMAAATSGQVMFGLDFHSTYNDVYYTQDMESMKTPTTSWLRKEWFAALESSIPGYKVNESASGLNSPVTKGWFYTQFGAEAMTYEIGDRTPRDSIQVIGKISANELMRIFTERQ